MYYNNPEKDMFIALARSYVAVKLGAIISPPAIDIHPVSGYCNLKCNWCIGGCIKTGFKKNTSLTNFMDKDKLYYFLNKILPPERKELWPSLFHFCGIDSEPLLQPDTVVSGINFLLEKNRIIKLVTNGLLLDDTISKEIAKIDMISISLDVMNNLDYSIYKLGKENPINDGYSRVLNNIENINNIKEKNYRNLKIRVTFVATPKTFKTDKLNLWHKCFTELKEVGVKEIKIRQDSNFIYGMIENLENFLESIQSSIDGVKIIYDKPGNSFSDKDFKYCRGCRLWPTLTANGDLYCCAHTATAQFQPFGNLNNSTSLIELYCNLFSPPSGGFLTVNKIGCNRMCPPIIGMLNDMGLASKILKNEIYI